MEKRISILLIDDHAMVIEGMKAILQLIRTVQVKATASNAFEAMDALKQHNIQLCFLDINLPDISGIDLCLKIKKEFPQIHIIGLSTFSQRSYIAQMMQNGASGYLLKSATKEEIEEAINTVMLGKLFFNISSVPNNNEKDAPLLTRREKEILILIADGLTNNEIATKLFLSPHTIDSHRKNLFIKFDVNNVALLIKKASQLDLL
ncbi:MAG: response regulator transcription factor [Chitinophagales bacterium]|jgi:two-component system nitrate/nitrite response regulator NarL|nr:response regulator transcription factor [Chitinophagales bacterium]